MAVGELPRPSRLSMRSQITNGEACELFQEKVRVGVSSINISLKTQCTASA